MIPPGGSHVPSSPSQSPYPSKLSLDVTRPSACSHFRSCLSIPYSSILKSSFDSAIVYSQLAEFATRLVCISSLTKAADLVQRCRVTPTQGSRNKLVAIARDVGQYRQLTLLLACDAARFQSFTESISIQRGCKLFCGKFIDELLVTVR